MRNFEAGKVDDEITVQDQIEVECARAVGDGVETVAAEFLLEGEQRAEKSERRERGFESEGGVEEARLIGDADWRRGVERGAGGDAADGGEARDCGGESDVWRAGGAGKVAAEGDGCEEHVLSG